MVVHHKSGKSKQVVANKHLDLNDIEHLVNRHIASSYQKPFQQHNVIAFNDICDFIDKHSEKPLILDSGCGTGLSSFKLAVAHPNHLVLGVDQSAARLGKSSVLEDGFKQVGLFRANCEDIWRLIKRKKIKFDIHCLFYPNPWPKSRHLIRRWHGHPVFPYLKSIAQKTVVRSNWRTYLVEFNTAWHVLTGIQGEVKELVIDKPISLFEKKYYESGHTLYELVLPASESVSSFTFKP